MSDITVSALQIANSHNYSAVANAIKLRIWYTGAPGGVFQDSLGNIVMCGNGSKDFYTEVAVTLVGTTLNIASYTIPSTDDSSCLTVKAHGRFYVNGAAQEFLFSDYIITNTLGSPINFDQLFDYQPGAIAAPGNPLYLTAPEVAALILASVGTLNDASATVKGRTKLSINPAVATNPIAVGANETDWTNLVAGIISKTGGLSFRADTDASGTDGIVWQTRGATKLALDNAGTLLTLGDNTVASSSRLALTTQSANVVSLSAQTFNLTNGPVGFENYKNNTWGLSYNSAFNGTKIVAGEVNFTWANEPKFSQSGGPFQSEHYLSWTDPTGAISIRPFGLVIAHATGDTTTNINGDVYFLRHASAGQGQTAFWHENGSFEFLVSTGAVSFSNNVPNTGGLRFRNAAGNNSIAPIYVDNSDDTILQSITNNIRSVARLFIGAIDTSEIRSNQETDTYVEMPGSNIFRVISGGVNKFRVDNDGVVINSALIFHSDGVGDFGKISGVNFRPNNAYVKLNVELGATGVFVIGANQVVGPRETGWTAGTGTANKAAFATYAGQNVSAAYVEAEAQATDDAVKANAQRILAIEAMLRIHGMMN